VASHQGPRPGLNTACRASNTAELTRPWRSLPVGPADPAGDGRARRPWRGWR
jgi:hypothetical protein